MGEFLRLQEEKMLFSAPGLDEDSLVGFDQVSKYYKDKKGKIVTAVDEVTLGVGRDRVVALVGESGSGKTTLGRLATGLIRTSKGSVSFDGKPIEHYRSNELWAMAQYIHQDPYGALDPYLTVGELLDRPLRYLSKSKDKKDRTERVSSFLANIGLENIRLNSRINRLSGGERQRVLVARAFILRPQFVAADEPTTMVDFIHRNEILELLQKLRTETRTSILFITHDLSLAAYLSDYAAIMYRGKIVEYGKGKEIIREPLHPYTKALFSVTPDKLAEGQAPEQVIRMTGSIQAPEKDGCRYADACPYVFEKCRVKHPTLDRAGNDHWVACYLLHS